MRILNLFFIFLSFQTHAVPLRDNILFAFEKCKTLSVDLEKGQLKESVSPAFDLHCAKIKDAPETIKCFYFDPGTDKKLGEEIFSGGSELGVAELKDKKGTKLKFLIGKTFASYENPEENKVCAGIYLFEQEALKKKVIK